MRDTLQDHYERSQRWDRARHKVILRAVNDTCVAWAELHRGRPALLIGVPGEGTRCHTFEPAVARELARQLLLAADGIDPLWPVQ